MSEPVSISAAVDHVHQLRKQQPGLWRLDSPTEAALVAQLCGRHNEEVIVSAGNRSIWTPEPDYCFAHLAPPCIRGSARFRHYYVLGQKPDYCALELAEQRGLLPTPQHRQQQERMPCSPTAADTTHEHVQAQEPDISSSCGGRTPVAQLRATHQHVEDSSPCNNIVRRLAADIKTGSAATLQSTLTEYSSFARRSTTSIRSRVSTHSDHSYDDDSTPLASPGRGWLIDAAAACPDTLDPDCHHGDAAMAPQLHDAVSAGHAAAELCTDEAAAAPPTQGQQTSDCGSLQSSASAGCSCEQETALLPHDLPAIAAAPSIHFKGFEAATVLQQALATTDSMQLNTPRLDLFWELRPHSNISSSNGTDNSMDEHNSEMQQPASTSPDTHRHLQPGNDCIQEGSSCSPAIESAICNESLPQNEHDATTLAALALQNAALVAVSVSNSDQQVVCKTSSSSGNMDGGINDNIDEGGFWSCDDDDDGDDNAACDSHPVLEDAVPMPALPPGPEEPCRLPLSPLLLKQLSQQLSFKEAAEDPGVKAYAASARSDDATTYCDWATVCSYEEIEQAGST